MGRIRLDLSSLNVPEDESRLMMLLDSRFKSMEDLVRHLSKSYPEVEFGEGHSLFESAFFTPPFNIKYGSASGPTHCRSEVVSVKQNVMRSQN